MLVSKSACTFNILSPLKTPFSEGSVCQSVNYTLFVCEGETIFKSRLAKASATLGIQMSVGWLVGLLVSLSVGWLVDL